MDILGRLTLLLFIPLIFILSIFGVFSLFNGTINVSQWEHDSKVANCCIIGIGTCSYYIIISTNWKAVRKLF